MKILYLKRDKCNGERTMIAHFSYYFRRSWCPGSWGYGGPGTGAKKPRPRRISLTLPGCINPPATPPDIMK